MKNVLGSCLLLVSASVCASDAPGSPGTATPQPYAPPPMIEAPANPDRPPLLRLPPVRHNQPEPVLPQLEPRDAYRPHGAHEGGHAPKDIRRKP